MIIAQIEIIQKLEHKKKKNIKKLKDKDQSRFIILLVRGPEKEKR